MTLKFKNMKVITAQEIEKYERCCDIGPVKAFMPDEVVPLAITADDLSERELNEVSFGEPLKWSVLVSDKMIGERKGGNHSEYVRLRNILCRLHNHDPLTGEDYEIIDCLVADHNKKRKGETKQCQR